VFSHICAVFILCSQAPVLRLLKWLTIGKHIYPLCLEIGFSQYIRRECRMPNKKPRSTSADWFKSGTDVTILKIFSLKNRRFLLKNTAEFCEKWIITLVFLRKTQFFRRTLAKIADNCDHNIDPYDFRINNDSVLVGKSVFST
jgi:hypothetical protein